MSRPVASVPGASLAAPGSGRPVEAPEPTHPCIRCGKPGVAAELALCELCNPLELAQPSATQVHGIAALGILVFIGILAIFARYALAGTGPFDGAVDGVRASAGGLAVTLVVQNDGKKAAATSCRVVEASHPVGGIGELVQTPLIDAESSVRFTATVTKFGTIPLDLDAICLTP
jgi:hypothetical protein